MFLKFMLYDASRQRFNRAPLDTLNFDFYWRSYLCGSQSAPMAPVVLSANVLAAGPRPDLSSGTTNMQDGLKDSPISV
jgi:hypothetical protein